MQQSLQNPMTRVKATSEKTQAKGKLFWLLHWVYLLYSKKWYHNFLFKGQRKVVTSKFRGKMSVKFQYIKLFGVFVTNFSLMHGPRSNTVGNNFVPFVPHVGSIATLIN